MQAKLPVVCTSEINFCKEITEKTGCGIVVNPLDRRNSKSYYENLSR